MLSIWFLAITFFCQILLGREGEAPSRCPVLPGLVRFHRGTGFRTNRPSPSVAPGGGHLLPPPARSRQRRRTGPAPGAALLPRAAFPSSPRLCNPRLLSSNSSAGERKHTVRFIKTQLPWLQQKCIHYTGLSSAPMQRREGMAHFRRIIYFLLSNKHYDLIQRNRVILCNNKTQQKLIIKTTP